MGNPYKYDLFISYASKNSELATLIVEKLESRGKKCFIAPRDITGGKAYASEIVAAISNSTAVLLVFSAQADKSAYVLREVNSAVSRNKAIIPLRIEDFLPSEAMEFYLGPTHWLNAFPQVLDTHLDTVVLILNSVECPICEATTKVKGPEVFDNNQLFALGYTKEEITMREIELDYLCVNADNFIMNDETEGTFDDWANITTEFADAGCALIIEDALVGYTYLLPLVENDYQNVIQGDKMIDGSMVELYALGGKFNAYISMLAIEPAFANQKHYILLLGWIFKKIVEWEKEDVIITKIGISVYSNMVKEFVSRFGFKKVCSNPANGDIYEAALSDIRTIPFFKKLVAQ